MPGIGTPAIRNDSGSVSITALPNEGQQTMANSISVAISSDQSAVPVDTELPAAAALADGANNPTTPLIGAIGLGFNGSTYDRLRVFNPDGDGITATGGTLAIANFPHIYNGLTWDRVRGDTTNGMDVDVTRSALPTGASTLAEQQTQTSHLSKMVGLEIPAYDYVSMTLSVGDTTETYIFKDGGSGGTTVATVVIVYTDSTREVLSTVTKT